MKYSPRLFIFLSFLLGFGLTLVSCSKPKEPSFVGVESFQVEEVRGSSTAVSAVLKWYNPNPYGFQSKLIDVQVFLNDRYFGTAMNDEKMEIPASDTFLLPMKMQIDSKALLKESMTLLVKKEAMMRVEGKAVLGRKGVYKTFPVAYSKLTNWK